MSKHKGQVPNNPKSKRYQMMKARQEKLRGAQEKDQREEGEFREKMEALAEKATREDKIIVDLGRGIQLVSANELAQKGITPKTHFLRKNTLIGIFTPVPKGGRQDKSVIRNPVDPMIRLSEIKGFEVLDFVATSKKRI
ncbi:MAG: hypothetical protein V1911_01690 [Candidatus Micrarchaeota archaeon]